MTQSKVGNIKGGDSIYEIIRKHLNNLYFYFFVEDKQGRVFTMLNIV